jgi:opacity protein-like surface antigen
MMKRRARSTSPVTLCLAAALVALAPAAAAAQVFQVTRSDARNTVNFNLGYFGLRGEDSRVDDDVLFNDLDSLAFDIGDFNGVTFGGEWLFGVTNYLEAGVGLGYYQQSVPSVYRDFQDSDGTEIEQELKLRIVPITATARFLPLGRGASVEPYVGGGIGFFNWRYSEVGEFVDFADFSIFRQRYIADGTAIGPVVLAGLRAPIGDAWSVGGEIRWQRAEGDGLLDEGLLGDKIDLGGWTTNFTVGIRF